MLMRALNVNERNNWYQMLLYVYIWHIMRPHTQQQGALHNGCFTVSAWTPCLLLIPRTGVTKEHPAVLCPIRVTSKELGNANCVVKLKLFPQER